MTPQSRQDLEEVFDAARELSPAGRATYLDRECAGNPELRREVEDLLAHDQSQDDLLDRPAWEGIASPAKIEAKIEAKIHEGALLGPYRLEALLGEGGMGQVFRARDTRLGRLVAIKFIRAEHTQRGDFQTRFQREARATAALNHPHICTLYDVGQQEGVAYLVMEYVEGQTLASRIREGPLPLDRLLRYAQEIAQALSAAHERGIIHRDLKPANLMLTSAGIKVLDFGLAKFSELSDGAASINHTTPHTILGTPAYMSPEQARGETLDPRSDLFSLGSVLYEAATGVRPFRGSTVPDILREVASAQPIPPSTLRPELPAGWDGILWSSLAKDISQRFQSAEDLTRALEELRNDPKSGEPRTNERGLQQGLGREGDPKTLHDAPSTPASGAAQRKNGWLWPSLAMAGLAASAILWWAPWRAQSNFQAVRFEIQPTAKVTFLSQGGNPRLSPDGRWAVFPGIGSDNVARRYLRALDAVDVRPLPGTETHNSLPGPVFWSPDSGSIAFSSEGGPFLPGQLQKMSISGGLPETICDVPAAVVGGTWNRDGVIVFAYNNGELMRVSSAGGAAKPVTVLDESRKETGHRGPQFLPDGRHFLYQRVSDSPENTGIFVGSIDVKPAEQSMKMLLSSDRQAVYAVFPKTGLTEGHGRLVFQRDTTLFAQPFDPDRLALSGEPVPVVDQVGSFAPGFAGLFSISDTGVLVYRSGPSGAIFQLAWFDSKGESTKAMEERGSYSNPAVAPDGTRIAAGQADFKSGNRNLWVLDTSRGTSTQLTFDRGRDDFPVWSPDGKQIIFASNRSGHMDLYQKSADGSGEERLLLKSETDKTPSSWSPDGRFLLYSNVDPKMGEDLWLLPLRGDPNPIPFLRTQFQESRGRFSPDARWIAYVSNESGTYEIYVRPFSQGGAGGAASSQWKVSKDFGVDPRWRGDGKELYYVGEAEMMAVDISPDKTFQAGVPKRLFGLPATPVEPDVTPDGKRFLVATSEGVNTTTPFTVVMNWQAALKK